MVISAIHILEKGNMIQQKKLSEHYLRKRGPLPYRNPKKILPMRHHRVRSQQRHILVARAWSVLSQTKEQWMDQRCIPITQQFPCTHLHTLGSGNLPLNMLNHRPKHHSRSISERERYFSL